MRAFTDSYNSLKSPERRQNIMTESWLVNKSLENITIINVHNPNNGSPKYMRQNLPESKGRIIDLAIRLWYFYIPLLLMDKTVRCKNQER